MKVATIAMGIGLGAFLVIGCGDAIVDNIINPQTNKKNVASATMTALGTSTDTPSYGKALGSGSRLSALNIVLHKFPAVIRPVLANTRTEKLGGTATEPCLGGGSMETTSSGNGTSVTNTVVYHSCISHNVTINGTMSVSDELSSGSLSALLTDLNATYSDGNVTYYSSASFRRTGQVSSLLTTEANITGYTKTQTEKTEFDNLKLVVTQNSENLLTYSLSGKLKPPCPNEWITFATPTTVTGNVDAPCPTAGIITATFSGSSVKTEFNSDGGVDVTLDGETTHYDSCKDIESNNSSCSVD